MRKFLQPAVTGPEAGRSPVRVLSVILCLLGLLPATVSIGASGPVDLRSIDKSGTVICAAKPSPVATASRLPDADFVFNTGGQADALPTTGGSSDGWGSHFVASATNTTGQDLYLIEFGFPCAGSTYGQWFVSLDGLPSGPSAEFQGFFFPVVDDPEAFPPATYTYVTVNDFLVVIPAGVTFYFGYANPGVGGQVPYNGTETWAWYQDAWDPDRAYGRTALLQVKASFSAPIATESHGFGDIKALYR